MNVRLEFHAHLRRVAGADDVTADVAATTVQAAVREFAATHAAREALTHPTVLLLHAGRRVGWDDATPLENGDVIALHAPIAGG